MRREHYLKPAKAVEIPSHIIPFDTETTPHLRADGATEHRLNFGYLAYLKRIESESWHPPQWFRFSSIAEFWDTVESKTFDKRRVYLFSHNGAFDLPVVDAFSELHHRGWRLKNTVMDAPPIMLTWRRGKALLTYIDTLNIWRMPLEAIGQAVGLQKLKMPAEDAPQEDWERYGKRDVEVLIKALLDWFAFLRRENLGSFMPTLASQSMRAFRHRFMSTPIFIDADERALAISRDAYLGGRVECFRLGRIDGPIYHYDINSMYPYVMQRHRYPIKLKGVFRRVKIKELETWCRKFCVTASVTLTTDEPAYPCVVAGRLCFPVGSFSATLTTPELLYAIKRDHLRSIDIAAVYEAGRPFDDFARQLYALRLAAKERGDDVAQWQFKILLNSFYGKFGQSGRRYETTGETDDTQIKVWSEIDADTGKVENFRQFGGIIQTWHDEAEARESHPAIAAHVTGYARLHLWRLLRLAGEAGRYYCDTDSILSNAVAALALGRFVHPTRLGALKLEGVYPWVELRGPKDYDFAGKVRVKGVRRGAVWTGPDTVQQTAWAGLKGLLRRGNLTAPITWEITKHLRREYTKGEVQPDGRVLPLRLNL